MHPNCTTSSELRKGRRYARCPWQRTLVPSPHIRTYCTCQAAAGRRLVRRNHALYIALKIFSAVAQLLNEFKHSTPEHAFRATAARSRSLVRSSRIAAKRYLCNCKNKRNAFLGILKVTPSRRNALQVETPTAQTFFMHCWILSTAEVPNDIGAPVGSRHRRPAPPVPSLN